MASALVALTLAFAASPALAAPTFPPLTGRVVDDAHVLSPATLTDLANKLAALEAKTGDQLVVVTLPDLQGYDIEDYGYQLGRAWQIGEKGKNNGVILIVVPSEHKVRIEVGYGLEPVLTDILSNVILQAQVLPKFRTGDYDGGVSAGADAIIAQLSADPA
ncbi:MAG TPA: TPM domain-containing protein, partial [Caulobacteraceae bacterium]|nr:TPM domain-containing protein [Caulobacteraceae bacterium]